VKGWRWTPWYSIRASWHRLTRGHYAVTHTPFDWECIECSWDSQFAHGGWAHDGWGCDTCTDPASWKED